MYFSFTKTLSSFIYQYSKMEMLTLREQIKYIVDFYPNVNNMHSFVIE